jgi:hypothetical protein
VRRAHRGWAMHVNLYDRSIQGSVIENQENSDLFRVSFDITQSNCHENEEEEE